MFDTKPKENPNIGKDIKGIPEKKSSGGTDEVMQSANVHTMPERFLPKKPKSKVSGKQKVIISAIILIVLLSGVIGGIIYFVSKNINQSDDNQQVVQNENTNTENENINENENTNTENENINENENTNTENENVNEPIVPPTSGEIDIDEDDLTDEEEIIYMTNSRRGDTDWDGHKDGVEIQNLYDPLISDELLIDSGLITVYQNPTFNYSIFRPKTWLSAPIDPETLDQVLFTPDSETGEFITLLVEPANNLSLTEWKDLNYTDVEFENFSLSDKPALRSLNSLEVFVKVNEYIYTLTYEVPEILMDARNFQTTFIMMLNSFDITEVEEEDDDNNVTLDCTEYTYSTCPDDCTKHCIPSSQVCYETEEGIVCDSTDDCEGPGSCVN